jgi:uncharacterized short protein YbdD (DUF466 family)
VPSDEQVEKLEKTMSKLLGIKPEEREKLLRIIREHKPQKIVKALNDVIFYDKRGKAKVVMTLDEFEKMLKKVRY